MTLTPHFCVALLSLCAPEKFTDLHSCASVTSQSQSLVAPNEVKTENPPGTICHEWGQNPPFHQVYQRLTGSGETACANKWETVHMADPSLDLPH